MERVWSLAIFSITYIFCFIGIAHVCLVTSSMTIVRAKIDFNIPRKRKGNCSQHDKVILVVIEIILELEMQDVW